MLHYMKSINYYLHMRQPVTDCIVLRPPHIDRCKADGLALLLTITGSGFGEILINVESALGVYILDRQGTVKCKADLISWNDAEIVAQAQCTKKSDTVRVTSLFGSAEASLGDKSRGGKPRGKK